MKVQLLFFNLLSLVLAANIPIRTLARASTNVRNCLQSNANTAVRTFSSDCGSSNLANGAGACVVLLASSILGFGYMNS